VLVIPAIDLKGGRCVRLKQGDMGQETVFSNVPEEMAARWYDAGAERIHVVDLDGATEGRPVNTQAIEAIVRRVPVPIQLGGGIRGLPALEAYFGLGVAYAILGTAALKRPGFIREACGRFPGRILLGLDARGGRLAVEGWREESTVGPSELARSFEEAGVSGIIYTDIQRDGMKTGPNVEGTRALAKATKIPVIASGGVSSLADVERLLTLQKDGVIGLITGRALYDGSLDLGEAIRAARGAVLAGGSERKRV
jgi:phosphoribosylformimino-5-aminoimidazole carboxamide ribotide isomerase